MFPTRSAIGGAFQPTTLDVDERILDRNLRIVEDDVGNGDGGSEVEQMLFGGGGNQQSSSKKASITPVLKEASRPLMPEPELPSVEVTPEPGICIKTKNQQGTKVFLNLCRVNEIPPAPPMSESRLRSVIADEDYDSDYRVPMSLGAPREEQDKSGSPCLACDVAVNSAWFADTVAKSDVFTAFVAHVAMEGLCEKYGDAVNLDRQNWTVLRNKKYLGKPQRHRVQKRAKGNMIEEVPSSSSSGAKSDKQKPMIQEVSTRATESSKSSPLMQEVSTKLASPQASAPSPSVRPKPPPQQQETPRERTPKYTIFKEPRDSENPERLVATIEMPEVRTVRELTLDVGEDRMVMEARKAGYILDVFLPFRMDGDGCSARFHRDRHVLTVEIPVL